MGKNLKVYIILLVVLLGFIVFVEYTADKPINWAKTYNENDKIPYGTFVFHDQLNQLFPNTEIERINTSAYEYFDALYDYENDDYDISGNYTQVEEFADIDVVSGTELVTYASKGHTVFISSNQFPKSILDSLDLKIKTDYSISGKAQLQLVNSRFLNDTVTVDKPLNNTYFKSFKKENTTVLGQQKFGDSIFSNFIKVKFHDGQVLLHLQPMAFTNYHLLKSKRHSNYTEAVLSYLPNENILYKSKNKIGADLSKSKLRFILSKPALKYAWYVGLVSLLLFLIFNAKRKQRIIKTITPLENSTVAFTKTIGNLYFETKDHTNLIHKKITYFLEYIRRVYYLDTQLLDYKFVKNLASKSNKNNKDIKALIDLIAVLRAKANHTEQDLLDLNTLIEDFYTH